MTARSDGHGELHLGTTKPAGVKVWLQRKHIVDRRQHESSARREADAEVLGVTVRCAQKPAAQACVEIKDTAGLPECPIGRRAFVGFPGIRMIQYLRAYLPGW